MTTPLATHRAGQRNSVRLPYSGGLPGGLLTIEEAAAHLKMSVRYMRRLVAERRIPFHRFGRAVRFDPVDLAKFVQAARIEPITPETAWDETRRAA